MGKYDMNNLIKRGIKSFSHDTANSRLLKTEPVFTGSYSFTVLIDHMARKLQLQIPTPCHENWEKMTQTEQGRFCASCQKHVIDFSNKSDREIAMLVLSQGINASEGSKSLTMTMPSIITGNYFLKLTSKTTGGSYTEKLIVD
jgi:hypothetical protein